MNFETQEINREEEAQKAYGIIALAEKLYQERVAEGQAEKERLISEGERKLSEAQERANNIVEDSEKEHSEIIERLNELRQVELDYRESIAVLFMNTKERFDEVVSDHEDALREDIEVPEEGLVGTAGDEIDEEEYDYSESTDDESYDEHSPYGNDENSDEPPLDTEGEPTEEYQDHELEESQADVLENEDEELPPMEDAHEVSEYHEDSENLGEEENFAGETADDRNPEVDGAAERSWSWGDSSNENSQNEDVHENLQEDETEEESEQPEEISKDYFFQNVEEREPLDGSNDDEEGYRAPWMR